MILWMISTIIGIGLMIFGVGVGSVADKMSDLYCFCRMAFELGMILLTIDIVILFIMSLMEVL